MLLHTVAALALVVALGCLIALAIDVNTRGPRLFAVAFLYGTGAVAAVMLLLSLVRIRWTAAIVCGALAVVALPFAIVLVRGRDRRHAAASRDDMRATPVALVIDGVSLVTLAFYFRYALAAPVWQWDFWAIWGLKARVFVEHGGIDTVWLTRIWNAFAHPDYPVLVPLQYSLVATLSGGQWNDRWLALFTVSYVCATIVLVRAAGQAFPKVMRAALTLLVCGVATTPFLGLADAPLAAFATAAVLFAEEGLRGDRRAMLQAGILLGLAGCVKNEGLALIGVVLVAAAFELLLTPGGKRRFAPLLAAPLIALPWTLYRAVAGLTTDLSRAGGLERALSRVPETPAIMRLLGTYLEHPWFWALLVATAALAAPGAWRGARFLLVVVALQLAVYLGAYYVTPYDIEWHVATSWSRLVSHVAPLAVFAVMRMVALTFAGAKESAAHAEARSQL